MKKNKFLILIILIFLAGLLLFKFLSQTKTTNSVVGSSMSTSSTFTPEQLRQYYATYQDPYVIALRTALNGYLDGTNKGMDDPQSVIESSSSSGAASNGNLLNGLSSFSKDYYKSKFIVFSIYDSIAGGKNIAIIFQDKPDKLFGAWVYKLAGGTYDLRGFSQVLSITPEQMKQIQEQYKMLLLDKNHAL